MVTQLRRPLRRRRRSRRAAILDRPALLTACPLATAALGPLGGALRSRRLATRVGGGNARLGGAGPGIRPPGAGIRPPGAGIRPPGAIWGGGGGRLNAGALHILWCSWSIPHFILDIASERVNDAKTTTMRSRSIQIFMTPYVQFMRRKFLWTAYRICARGSRRRRRAGIGPTQWRCSSSCLL